MYLGIEIGGTKLQVGLGAGDGRIAALWRGRVEAARGAEAIRQQLAQAVPQLLAQAGVASAAIRGVGIGFGGPTDDVTRRTLTSHQVHGWDNFPLADWAEAEWGWPTVICNDADVAGLGEALFGAGRGLSPLFYMTIGSGIGGALIVDGTIYRGAGRGAVEVGHLPIPTSRTGATGEPPQRLPLETLASGWGIAEQARRALRLASPPTRPASRLDDRQLTTLTAQDVADAARQGDCLASAVIDQACVHLAEALATVVLLLCPRRIVIGGGVSLMGDLLFTPLRNYLAERTFPPFAGLTDVHPARLGEEVVVHGALAMAAQRRG